MKTFQEFTKRLSIDEDEDDLVYRDGKLYGFIGNRNMLGEGIIHRVDGASMEDAIEKIRKSDNPTTETHVQHHEVLVAGHPGIPESHHKFVRKYVDSSYSMNKGLFVRASEGHNPLEKRPVLKATINGLDQLHHPVSGKHVVYSGVRWNPETASGMVYHHDDDNIAMHLPAFTSTSTSLRKAAGFATASERSGNKKNVIRFTLKHGDKAFPIHQDFSYATDESEVLLPRNTIVKISRKPSVIITPKMGSHIPSEETHIWDAQIIHQPRENDPV